VNWAILPQATVPRGSHVDPSRHWTSQTLAHVAQEQGPVATAVRRDRWIDLLAWMEIIAGAVGLLVYVWLVVKYPRALPAWHGVLGVVFFGANIVAGILLRDGRRAGFTSSFILQLLQVLVLNFGTMVVFRAGLHLTGVIASTGAGLLGGPASIFTIFPTSEGGFNASGLGYALYFGFFVHPLKEAQWAIGVNFVALYFARRLWVTITAPAGIADAPRHVMPPWVWRGVASGVGIIGLWVAIGGPQWGTYAKQWPLATGDTVEILKYVKQYNANYVLNEHGVRLDTYLWLQFRSDLQDTARDHANAVAAAALVCPETAGLGLQRLLVEPTSTEGVMRHTHEYWFRRDSTGNCQEAVGK
jgi:hypothetical protein